MCLQRSAQDLVTNDVVAVIELVKNSYDAYATRVDVIFGNDEKLGRHLDIVDDGVGMNRETLEEAWCVVATPIACRIQSSVKEGTHDESRGRKVSGDSLRRALAINWKC